MEDDAMGWACRHKVERRVYRNVVLKVLENIA
jgi:hypothetical protein